MSPEQVRAARHMLGMTQDELAKALRMGRDGKRAVRRWEAGDRCISGPASVAIDFMLVADYCKKTGKGVWSDDQPENGN